MHYLLAQPSFMMHIYRTHQASRLVQQRDSTLGETSNEDNDSGPPRLFVHHTWSGHACIEYVHADNAAKTFLAWSTTGASSMDECTCMHIIKYIYKHASARQLSRRIQVPVPSSTHHF